MVHKSIPFYYLLILWLVAIVSVFFIVKPLVSSIPVQNDFGSTSDFTSTGGNNEHSGQVENKTTVPGSSNKDAFNTTKEEGLIFYNKTAFIRYFSDKYSEEELAESYNQALAKKTNSMDKAPIRVVRKGIDERSKKSFSGSFDIKPVPVNTHQ
jgi:hypothetical protein